MRFVALFLNCPSVIPRAHGFGVPFVLYSTLHVHNLRCRLPSRENARTWKGQRKILKARWANLWRNTSDDVLREKISVSWAILAVSYPTVAATHDAPLQRGMGVKRLTLFLFASFLFWPASLFRFPLEFRTNSELIKIFTVCNKHLGMRYVGLSSTEGCRILLEKKVKVSTSLFPKT